MLPYDLGDMIDEDGSILWYEVEKHGTDLALSISHKIEQMPLYRELAQMVPSPHLLLYFQFQIRKEIYSYVRQGLIIQWYRRCGREVSAREGVVKVPRQGIFPLLVDCWDIADIPIETAYHPLFSFTPGYTLRRQIKSSIKWCTRRADLYFREDGACGGEPREMRDGGVIACHYAEGIDRNRRNDLNWFWESGISPAKVLYYFDTPDSYTGLPIKREVISWLEKNGFRWVALRKGIIEGGESNYWTAPLLPRSRFIVKGRARNAIDRWIIDVSRNLLQEVHYWVSFHNDFNVRIHYIPEEGLTKNIAQAIAFDIEKERPGFLAGKQRSEAYIPYAHDCFGFHPKHIFFIWSRKVASYVDPNHDKQRILVVSGYPNSSVNKSFGISESPAQALRAKGAKFVVALFDNTPRPDAMFSIRGISLFYQAFLNWVFDDPTVGIVIKSKKPHVIRKLASVHSLFDRAAGTGRCIRMEREWGMFPSEASAGADVAVGCGISSAVIEAVLGGCRGIHYDVTHLKCHEYYRWGFKELIFDDLDELMIALKGMKSHRERNMKLGNWTPHMDDLDPFHDGNGSRRMGMYMRWLLESLEEGRNSGETIECANRRYAQMWGEDKIIDPSRYRSAAEGCNELGGVYGHKEKVS